EGQWSFLQTLGERLAFEIFHDQEVAAILRTNVVERADIRMLERRNSFCFALHALSQFRVRGKMRRQNLDSNNSVEARVLGAVDFAHPARAQRRLNFIWTELRARGKSHRCWQL